eukprot:scaffold305642_cov23-Tisochrysis_lutea.AAC.2
MPQMCSGFLHKCNSQLCAALTFFPSSVILAHCPVVSHRSTSPFNNSFRTCRLRRPGTFCVRTFILWASNQHRLGRWPSCRCATLCKWCCVL